MRNPLPFTRNPLFYGSTDLQTNDRPQFLPDIKNIVSAFLGMGWITTKVAWKGSIMVKLMILSKNGWTASNLAVDCLKCPHSSAQVQPGNI